MKKHVSLILALLLVLALPVTAFATEDSITWTLSEDGKTMSDGQKTYERYPMAYVDMFEPVQAYVWEQEIPSPENPDDAWYNFTIMIAPEFPEVVILTSSTYSEDMVFVTKEGAAVLEAFTSGNYASMVLEDPFYSEGAVLSLDWVDGLDSSDGARETLDVKALGEVDPYIVWGGDETDTFYHPHGAFYSLDGTWYYINYDALDNSYFDADGFFSYRKGTVEALPIDGEDHTVLTGALEEMTDWETEFLYEGNVLNLDEDTSKIVFWIFAILLGFVLPLVPLILGIVFAHSKKALHPKRWYVLSILSAAWIAVAALILILLAA